MPKQTVQIEIENSGYNILIHASKLYAAMKEAMKDGFQPGADVPVAVAALIAEMPGLLSDAQHVHGDIVEDELAFIKGANLGLYEVLKVVKG